MHIHYRTMTAADGDWLPEMIYQSIHVSAGKTPPDRDILNLPKIARYGEAWGRAGDFGIAVVDADTDQVVGAVWARLWQGDDQGYGFVDTETPELSIALLPDYRGQGIGSVLMDRVIEMAAGRYPALSLSVSPDNPAMRLYERLGFVVVGQSGESLTMLKTLPED